MEPNLNTGLVRNTLILAKFELKKLLFNPKGLVALIAFALVWMLILLYPIRGASDILLSADFRQLIAGIFGESSVDRLFQWQVAEMAIFWVAALYLFPLFSIFVSADQFSSDKSRG
ncbi:MAG: ABC transporter, partial [Shewanella sp.]|nr:ABC transporter [Shewanella sp.]